MEQEDDGTGDVDEANDIVAEGGTRAVCYASDWWQDGSIAAAHRRGSVVILWRIPHGRMRSDLYV